MPVFTIADDEDTAIEPLQSVPLSTETCAIEKCEPRQPDEFGILISGVGEAATQRAKLTGFKAKAAAKMAAALAAAGKGNAGMYKLSVETEEQQNNWVRKLMRIGLGGDIAVAQQIEAEQRAEREEEERAEAARREAEEEAAAEAMAEQLFAGAGGGGGAGGAGSAFEQVNQAKMMAQQNIEALSEMSQKTQEMENNSADFAKMARELRERESKKKGFF
eukprot:SAG11_NODE_941_length_6455_cov_5.508181_1_plen_219_part_00